MITALFQILSIAEAQTPIRNEAKTIEYSPCDDCSVPELSIAVAQTLVNIAKTIESSLCEDLLF